VKSRFLTSAALILVIVAISKAEVVLPDVIGEANDIHPKNKLDVGKRMCRWALADVYGRKTAGSGPMFRAAKVAGSWMVLTFDHAGAGLFATDGGKLDEFAIAGADHQWHWADARIVGKDRIEVWSDAVPQPTAVRYAFNNNPKHPNLTNEARIPAAPFRTDLAGSDRRQAIKRRSLKLADRLI
jgi:sialate O-acetylesterase